MSSLAWPAARRARHGGRATRGGTTPGPEWLHRASTGQARAPPGLGALQSVAAPDDVPRLLEGPVDVAVERYLTTAYASPVLLVHTATAPNAVLHVLPVLPTEYWVPSFEAAWSASAALVAAYAPPIPASSEETDGRRSTATADAVLQRAVEHGDEPVLKFADTAVEAFERTENPDLLAASLHAGVLIVRP